MVALVIFVGLTLQAGRLEGPASSSSSPVSSRLSPPLLAGRSGIRTCPTKVAKTILETCVATIITSFRHHNHVDQQHDHDQHDHHHGGTMMMMMMMNRSMMMMMNILTIRHKSRGKFKPNLQREETIRVTKVLAGPMIKVLRIVIFSD